MGTGNIIISFSLRTGGTFSTCSTLEPAWVTDSVQLEEPLMCSAFPGEGQGTPYLSTVVLRSGEKQEGVEDSPGQLE